MRTDRREYWKLHWRKYKHLYKGSRYERRNKWRVKWEDRFKAYQPS